VAQLAMARKERKLPLKNGTAPYEAQTFFLQPKIITLKINLLTKFREINSSIHAPSRKKELNVHHPFLTCFIRYLLEIKALIIIKMSINNRYI
jgi:hypothetical protein